MANSERTSVRCRPVADVSLGGNVGPVTVGREVGIGVVNVDGGGVVGIRALMHIS